MSQSETPLTEERPSTATTRNLYKLAESLKRDDKGVCLRGVYDLEDALREAARLRSEVERLKAERESVVSAWQQRVDVASLQWRQRAESAQKRIAAALEYVKLHMDEDINGNGQANDGMSLRTILEGRDG